MKKIFLLFITVLATFAVSAQEKAGKKDSVSHAAFYTCPMHPDVKSDKAGKCPKCGMDLTKIKTYSCPMHPEVTSNKPGKCGKCGMDLTEVKPKDKKG